MKTQTAIHDYIKNLQYLKEQVISESQETDRINKIIDTLKWVLEEK